MTDHLATLRQLAAEARSKGHENLILRVERKLRTGPARTPRGRVRIAPGLTGRWLGGLPDGRDGFIVEVAVAAVEAWLERTEPTS